VLHVTHPESSWVLIAVETDTAAAWSIRRRVPTRVRSRRLIDGLELVRFHGNRRKGARIAAAAALGSRFPGATPRVKGGVPVEE